MPNIVPSSELRNRYNEISEFCHQHEEPIFITKNGQGDLAVMSMETFEKMSGKLELYQLLEAGFLDIRNHNTLSCEEAFALAESRLDK